MNRHAAANEIVAWRIICNKADPVVHRKSVRALIAAAQYWQDEAERLADVVRCDTERLGRCEQTIRELSLLLEQVPDGEHVEAAPVTTIDRAMGGVNP